MQSFSMRPAEAHLCSHSPSISGRPFQQVFNVPPARNLQAQGSQRRHPLRATSTDVSSIYHSELYFRAPETLQAIQCCVKLLNSRALH